MERFLDEFRNLRGARILDVGGFPWFWADSIIDAEITILNLDVPPATGQGSQRRFTIVQGDGTKLPYHDGEFDLVFSNSVIEHLGSYEQQTKFANEARRVGKELWIQTPAKSFPIEPHLVAPCIHWLPKKVQLPLIRPFTYWGWVAKPNRKQIQALLDELRLLNEAEVKKLFPDCEILRESALGLTKSYIAVRRSEKSAKPYSSPGQGVRL
jgi:hypothetical protein